MVCEALDHDDMSMSLLSPRMEMSGETHLGDIVTSTVCEPTSASGTRAQFYGHEASTELCVQIAIELQCSRTTVSCVESPQLSSLCSGVVGQIEGLELGELNFWEVPFLFTFNTGHE